MSKSIFVCVYGLLPIFNMAYDPQQAHTFRVHP